MRKEKHAKVGKILIVKLTFEMFSGDIAFPSRLPEQYDVLTELLGSHKRATIDDLQLSEA